MENKEKYSFYKQKLKKQTQSLLIISIIILIINIHFVTMNFTSASNMYSYFTVWDIKLLKYITINLQKKNQQNKILLVEKIKFGILRRTESRLL